MIPSCFYPSVPLNKRTELPTNPGIYYLIQWFNPWKILYVGKAANLRSRWSGNSHHKLKQALRKPGIRIYYRTTWTKGQAKELEAIEQSKYNPPWCDRIESLSPSFITILIRWSISAPISIALYWVCLQYWNSTKTEPPKLESYRVIQLANLREKPDFKSKPICTISKGTILKAEVSPDWKPVKICGTAGYTHKSNLLMIKN